MNEESNSYCDTKLQNSYVRLRRDHLKKLGHANILKNEIDQE